MSVLSRGRAAAARRRTSTVTIYRKSGRSAQSESTGLQAAVWDQIWTEINEANLARVRIDTSNAVDDGHGHDLTPPPMGGATPPTPPDNVPGAEKP